MNPKWICLVVVLFGCALAEKTSYVGYKLYNIYPITNEQIELISQLQHNPDFDLWTRLRGGHEGVKVALGPDAQEKYQALFKLFKIRFEIVHSNLQERFDEEERQMSTNKRQSSTIVGKYVRFNEINNWISDQVEANPTLVRRENIGRSYENRTLIVIKIGNSSPSARKIWIDCGIHAREWVSPSTCVWIADKLIKEYNTKVPDTVELLNYYEFIILPVVNPDGYEYTFTNTRLWRKNRKINQGSICVGVDLNRNFGYQWMTGGSSNLPCSDTYAGPSADSELETQAIENAIRNSNGLWDAYLTIHSYGKWLFTPFGYTKDLPVDFDDLDNKAGIAVDALQAVYNETGWTHGSSARILYIGSGGSEDWTYGIAKIRHSYCFELRPGQTGTDSNFGFELPVDKAPLAGEETYQGIKSLVKQIRDKP